MEKEKMIQLVTAAQAGNQQAISDLFNAYHTDVYNIALRETKSPDTAADVMQESFIEVIQTIGKLQEPAAFMSWLKAITYHQCTRYYRKKENKHEQLLAETEDTLTVFDSLEEENTEFIPDMALENAELGRTIRGFVEDLPDSQRAAIMMKYYDELSVKEIAAVQGVSENTVLSRLYYGRNAIKGEVEAYEKKHNVKLHVIPFLPLLRGAFSEAPKRVAAKTTVAAAKAISTATGVKVTATGVGIAGTVAALPLATKIGAGIAAAIVAVVAIGIGNGGDNTRKPKNDNAQHSIADTTSPTTNDDEDKIPSISDREIEEIFFHAKKLYDQYIYERDTPTSKENKPVVDRDIFPDFASYEDFVSVIRERFSADAVERIVQSIGLYEYEGVLFCNTQTDKNSYSYKGISIEKASEKTYKIDIAYTNSFETQTYNTQMFCVYENDRWVVDNLNFYSEAESELVVVDPFELIDSIYIDKTSSDSYFTFTLKQECKQIETSQGTFYLEPNINNTGFHLSDASGNGGDGNYRLLIYDDSDENVVQYSISVAENKFADDGILFSCVSKSFSRKTYDYLKDVQKITEEEFSKFQKAALKAVPEESNIVELVSAYLYVADDTKKAITPNTLFVLLNVNGEYRYVNWGRVLFGSDGTLKEPTIPTLNNTVYSSENEFYEAICKKATNLLFQTGTITKIDFP